MAQRPENISRLHALSFIYSVCAGIDCEAHPNEVYMATQKLIEWAPDQLSLVAEVSRETANWIISCSGFEEMMNEAQACVNWLSDMPEKNKRAIIDDIRAIVYSDGVVSNNESIIFEAIVKDLGFELN